MSYKPVNVSMFVVVWILLLGLVVTAWNYRHVGYLVGRQTGTVIECRSFSSFGGRAGSRTTIYRQIVHLEDSRNVSVHVDHCSYWANGETVSLLRKRRYLLGTEFFVIDDIQPVE